MIKRCYQTELLPTKASYGITFDPGINRTGYCVWDIDRRRPVEIGALITSGADGTPAKLAKLQQYASTVLDGFLFVRAFVEEFVSYVPTAKARDMIKCGSAQGLLYGLCCGRGITTDFICKGRASKDEATFLALALTPKAKDWGKDEKDALHLADLADWR